MVQERVWVPARELPEEVASAHGFKYRSMIRTTRTSTNEHGAEQQVTTTPVKAEQVTTTTPVLIEVLRPGQFGVHALVPISPGRSRHSSTIFQQVQG